MHFLVLCAAIFLAAIIICRNYLKPRNQLNLPPGPTGLPLIGNIFDLPEKGKPEHQHWLTHKNKYGSISSVTVLGQTIVILHDKDAIHDVLDIQSAKSSGRPNPEFAHGLCGFDKIMGGQQYDDCYRRRRKIVHRQFGSKSTVRRYNDVQEVEARRFLARILSEPERLLQHLKSMTAAIILKVTYGYSIDCGRPDPLVMLIERWMSNFSAATVPLSYLVDILPVLKHLPDWAPGAGFKETGRRWSEINHAAAHLPYHSSRQQIKSGHFVPSYVSRALQQLTPANAQVQVFTPRDEEDIIWTAANLYAGGSDTTVSSIYSFVLAMTLHPEVQKRAQDEITNVIGTERLPDFKDRENLPYVDAVVTEIYRWHPVGPMGLPHKSDEEIIYKDYRIPEGSYLLSGIWSILHDPDIYVDPHKFDPARFLEPRRESNPMLVAFGAGRRICPGRFFADNTIFISVAQMLAAFNISKAVDNQGREIDVALTPMPGIICHLNTFQYEIRPRSSKLSHYLTHVD